MGKWLLGGTVALAVMLAILLYQLKSSASPAPVAPAVAAKAAPANPSGIAPNVAAQMAALGDAVKPADGEPHKIKPQSDEFFAQFDELQPTELTRQAAKCYHRTGAARLHRNQKLKLKFKDHITNGEVTVSNVEVVESTLNDPVLESCMVSAVKGTHWHNDNLPEWEMDDTLLIRPERGMKKFSDAAMADEGTGPIGPAVMKPGQAPPISDTATKTDFDRAEAAKAQQN